jgi:hypothetical protein
MAALVDARAGLAAAQTDDPALKVHIHALQARRLGVADLSLRTCASQVSASSRIASSAEGWSDPLVSASRIVSPSCASGASESRSDPGALVPRSSEYGEGVAVAEEAGVVAHAGEKAGLAGPRPALDGEDLGLALEDVARDPQLVRGQVGVLPRARPRRAGGDPNARLAAWGAVSATHSWHSTRRKSASMSDKERKTTTEATD